MEFPFADDFFEESIAKREKASAPISYNAKIVNDKWFDDEDPVNSDSVDSQQRVRFGADYAYYTKDYSKSLELYKQCLGMLPPDNVTVWREITESLARCYGYLNMKDEAVNAVESVREAASTFEQRTSAWYTASHVYRQLGLTQDSLRAQQALSWLHSSNPGVWRALGDMYLDMDSSVQNGSNSEAEQKRKWFVCYTRARILLKAVSINVTGSVKDRNMTEEKELVELCKSFDATNKKEIIQNVRTSIEEKMEELTDHQLAVQIEPWKEDFCEEFEEKFFPTIT